MATGRLPRASRAGAVRPRLRRLCRALLILGAVMAAAGVLDYMNRGVWFAEWREPVAGRLSATFVNPDHFGAWLSMLIALGLGWMVARAPGRCRGSPSLRESVRALREQAARTVTEQAPSDVEARLGAIARLEGPKR